MDWSVLQSHARYPFLRDELIYSNFIPVRVTPLKIVQLTLI